MKPLSDPIDYKHVDCRKVRKLLEQIGNKWTIIVVSRLSHGPMRFNALKRDIGTISQKVLTQTLRELERDGLVKRVVMPILPPHVDYELTDLGYDLLGPIHVLGAWAVANESRIDAARDAYDSRD